MKIKTLFVAVLLMAGVLVAPANAAEKPTVESFKLSPLEIDLLDANTNVTFELIVSHPAGIEDLATLVTLTNSRNDTLSVNLARAESSLTSTKVVFRGSLSVPRNINTGTYTYSARSVQNNSTAGYQYETGTIDSEAVRTLVGAEKGLLVRSGGDLNFDYSTFVGPSFDSSLGISYNDSTRFNSSIVPIWKVGETFDPTKFFEVRVPSLSLSIISTTPTVCLSDGKSLSLLKEGMCSFTVSTPKTRDYLARSVNLSTTVTSARVKSILNVEKIANQDIKDLGKSIELVRVYSAAEGWVLPASITPTVCFATSTFVKLIAGGTCKLTYQTAATSTYLASDLYTVSFDILKDGQPVVAPTPVATPTPTPTAKPVVKKTITCVKGKKTVKKTAVSPKCPKGYKLKK
jgi:hypothetical protein